MLAARRFEHCQPKTPILDLSRAFCPVYAFESFSIHSFFINLLEQNAKWSRSVWNTLLNLFIGLVAGGMCGGMVGVVLPLALWQVLAWTSDDPSAGGFVGVLLIATVPICAFIGAVIGVLVTAGVFKRK